MGFTVAEKIQIALICDLAKPPNNREMDFAFIWNSVRDDEEWAIDWKYSGMNLQVPTPPKVSLVIDILEMWDRLELNFEALSEEEQARVLKEAYDVPKPHFLGFDGNNETELMHTARTLVHDLEKWQRFKDRDLDAHMPCIDVYHRMLSVWRPLWAEKIRQGSYTFEGYAISADEIISVLRERIYPGYREHDADGKWTFDRSKIPSR